MKLLYTTLLFTLMFTSKSMAQSEKKRDADLIEFSQKKKEFIFKINTPPSIEEITNTSRFYTDFFTTTYNIEKGEVIIKMVKDDEIAYKVISRFLTSNDIEFFNYKNETYKSENFYTLIK